MEGIIYYNIGHKCLVRLAVSIYSLRKVYKGNVTILADEEGYGGCSKIARHFGTDIKKASFVIDSGRNVALLNKCRINQITPYDKSIFVDSDTLIFKDFSECFKTLDNYEFLVPQFCNWKTNSRRIRKRIMAWQNKVYRQLIDRSLEQPHAINIGFYAFQKDAKIFDHWYGTAIKNRDSFIPDEIACQILVGSVNHFILPSTYNTSCKHEFITPESKMVHYHGRKHCRLEDGRYVFNSKLWYDAFDKLRGNDFIEDNIYLDKMLRSYLPHHLKLQAAK